MVSMKQADEQGNYPPTLVMLLRERLQQLRSGQVPDQDIRLDICLRCRRVVFETSNTATVDSARHPNPKQISILR